METRSMLKSSITTRLKKCYELRSNDRKQEHNNVARTQKLLPAIHPGEILRAEFMEPLQLSMNRLALDLRVPVTRIAEIVHERRGITPDTALRLARYFNTSAGFWMNLQTAYDLEIAQDRLARVIEREVRPAAMATASASS